MDAYDESGKTGPGPDGPGASTPAVSEPAEPAEPAESAESTPAGSMPDGAVPDGAVPDGSVPEARASEPVTSESESESGPGPESGTEPAPALVPAPAPTPDTPLPAPTGIAALSLRYQIAAALALAVVAVAACVHLGMVFLHVAPSNTVTKQHGKAIDEWIYPEFEQNWKLFAPNPLQQNVAVQVRALVRTPDGTSRETGWYDLSALDGRLIDGNPLPSHTQQNELRRAWDFYASAHDSQNRPVGLRGDLSERYLRRVAVLGVAREHAGGKGAVVERVQVRSRTTNVPPPKWSEEQVSDKPMVRELPWWPVPESDREDGLTEASAR
ncbi:DUF5819 family protein [Streptomyces sp. NBC_01236]|uniref:DUF5819 family protein n=1 Tax=Streptomyces sp. NBC_01236 TaxID=2903789 RepID=UPI002E126783|nr:DUF5819 family protein [Streptomyces sp. NBC_01236]